MEGCCGFCLDCRLVWALSTKTWGRWPWWTIFFPPGWYLGSRWHLSPGAGLSNPGRVKFDREQHWNAIMPCLGMSRIPLAFWKPSESVWMDSISNSQDDVRMLWEINLWYFQMFNKWATFDCWGRTVAWARSKAGWSKIIWTWTWSPDLSVCRKCLFAYKLFRVVADCACSSMVDPIDWCLGWCRHRLWHRHDATLIL